MVVGLGSFVKVKGDNKIISLYYRLVSSTTEGNSITGQQSLHG